jgi:hypothetical protein
VWPPPPGAAERWTRLRAALPRGRPGLLLFASTVHALVPGPLHLTPPLPVGREFEGLCPGGPPGRRAQLLLLTGHRQVASGLVLRGGRGSRARKLDKCWAWGFSGVRVQCLSAQRMVTWNVRDEDGFPRTSWYLLLSPCILVGIPVNKPNRKYLWVRENFKNTNMCMYYYFFFSEISPVRQK